jgi:hypothetical protein
METQKLYRDHAYLKECEAQMVAISEQCADTLRVFSWSDRQSNGITHDLCNKRLTRSMNWNMRLDFDITSNSMPILLTI